MGGPSDFQDPFDIFSAFFNGGGPMGGMGGGARARNRPTQGDDERVDMVGPPLSTYCLSVW